MMPPLYTNASPVALTLEEIASASLVQFSAAQPARQTRITLTTSGTADLSTQFLGHGTWLDLAPGDNHLTLGAEFDTLRGNAGNDWIAGGGGWDDLDGGAGVDTLYGGGGNDRLGLAASGAGRDLAYGGDGNDAFTIRAGATTGGAFYTADGGAGNDTFDLDIGALGRGMLVGGAGTDTVLVSGFGERVDMARDLVLRTSTGIETIDLRKSLYFNDANHVADFGTASLGAYFMGLARPNFVFGAGGDLFRAAGVTGRVIDMGAGDDTVYAGAGDAVVIGGAGNDLLFLGAGNDTVYIQGRDSVNGGLGDDRFIVEFGSTGARLRDDGGVDTLVITGPGAGAGPISLATRADLGLDILGIEAWDIDRNFTATAGNDLVDLRGLGLMGVDPSTVLYDDRIRLGAGDDRFYGRGAGEAVDGEAGNDLIDGGGGKDTLYGDAGDTLIGGLGDDRFVVTGQATIVEAFGGGYDQIWTSGDFDLRLVAGGIEVLMGRDPTFRTDWQGVVLNGSAGAERIIGSSGNDTLIGNGGADTLQGSFYDDTYIVDNAGVTIIEDRYGTQGDVLRTSVNSWVVPVGIDIVIFTGTGNFMADCSLGGSRVVGGAGNDTILGGGEVEGGAGDDYYRNPRTIIETVGGGHDTVELFIQRFGSAPLWENVEDVILTGPGELYANALDNRITSSNLGGMVDGRAGADTMIGGTGNDTFVMDQVGDVVSDAGGLADALYIDGAGDYALAQGFEKVTLRVAGVNVQGTAGDEAFDAYWTVRIDGGAGNDLLNGSSYDDTLTGGLGNDTLKGSGGHNILDGGMGDDVYYLRSADDVILDAGGYDELFVLSLGLVQVAQGIEKVTLQSGGMQVSGNAVAETYQGSQWDDVFDGGGGLDTITGGGGQDAFYFWQAQEAVQITDFRTGGADQDYILLEGGVGGSYPLAEGLLTAGQFMNRAPGQALTSATRLYYTTDTHQVWFDPDGSGARGGLLLATLTGTPPATLDILNFFVV